MVLSLKMWAMLVLLAIGAILLAWGTCIRLTEQRGRFCAAPPGWRPAWRWLRWLWPPRWLLVKACFYDLSGLHGDARGVVRCPECGNPSRRTLRSTRRLRRITIGLACIIAGAATPNLVHHINWFDIASHIPVRVLIVMEHVLGSSTPLPFRNELRARFATTSFDEWETDHFIDLLVRDLKADKVWNNGETAVDTLENVITLAEPSLERALKSDDWQQRQLAADLLRSDKYFLPTEDLFRVTMEGLRQDSLPWSRVDGRYNFIFNASRGTEYLVAHARQAEAFLSAGLKSDDAQQRFLSAAVAGLAGRDSLADQAVPILIEHLKDNHVSDDAMMATSALAGFGPSAMATLEALRDSPDRQQRGLVRLILARLIAPEDEELTPSEIQIRITGRTDDPTTLSIDYLSVPDMEGR